MGYSSRQGSVWFGSAEADFPTVTELAFLRAAASLAATGLQAARSSYELTRASRAKDEFLAMLGHELRNPLAPITTALELIKRESGGRFGEHHRIIERQVGHLSRLVEDLFDVNRITRGKIELRLETLRIGSVLARAAEASSPLVEERRQALTLDLVDEAAQVVGDMTRLTQVFANLLTNAAKYTDVGGQIRVHAQASEGVIAVSIADNGAGISAELMPRLFTIFEQGGTTIDRSKGGLGIGLAVVKNLVELHGGKVAAISRGLGTGAEFIVTLPIVPGPSEAKHAVCVEGARAISPRHRGTRVLLVDDNEDGLASMGAFLADIGFDVATALDPIAALDIAARFEPTIAILDIGLPGMDGYRLADALRRQQPCAPRFFALSGYGQSSDRERSRAAGFERHFVKPVALPDLVEALHLG
jgi:signal transduction histidine kinase/CheY-like chemotaxis protein